MCLNLFEKVEESWEGLEGWGYRSDLDKDNVNIAAEV